LNLSSRIAALKNIGITSIANIIQALAQWVLLIITVKVFDEALLGQLVLTLSVTTPLFLFFSFKIRTLITTDYNNTLSIEQYLYSRAFSFVFTILIMFLCSVTYLEHITLPLLIALTLFKLADGISELCYSYQHKHGQFDVAAKSQVTRSISAMLVLFSTAYFTRNEGISFAAWSLVYLLFVIWDLYKLKKTAYTFESRTITFSNLTPLTSASKNAIKLYQNYWPVGLSLLFGALFIYIPNYFIQFFYGEEQVGMFAAVSYFLIAGSVVITSMSQAMTPQLSVLFNQQEGKRFSSLVNKLVAAGALIGLLSVAFAQFFGEWLLNLVYSNAISQLSQELVLVLIASAIRFSYIFYGSALNAMHCYNKQSWVYGIGTLSLTVLCLYLIPNYGTLGAGYAMISACIIELFVMLYLYQKQLKLGLKSE